MDSALALFEELSVRDVVLLNAMINVQIGEFDMALEGELHNGRVIHGFVMKMEYDLGVAISNALIDMYRKCKWIGDALKIFWAMVDKDICIEDFHEQSGDHDGTLRLFDEMLHVGVRPDLVTATAILRACAHLAALRLGREIHGCIIVNGLAKDLEDVMLNNAVMDMDAECRSMTDAHLVFSSLRYKDVASWNIMIMGYGMNGYGNEALEMLLCMCESQLRPDEVTFVGILSACNHVGLVSQGRELFAEMEPKNVMIPTIEHYISVLDILGRAAQLEEAYELAVTMPIEANPVFYVLMSNVYGAADRYEDVSDRDMRVDVRLLLDQFLGVGGKSLSSDDPEQGAAWSNASAMEM
ncbi:Pentatricopeptide repeat [Dillenia turbinata]|uniref:Pentatricopeptide repeat n=1 Tax=Dillenia turbinata TaxID=194707 RepID=A0AAN8YW32_9MAGN